MSNNFLNKRLRYDTAQKVKNRRKISKLVEEKIALKRTINNLKKKNKKLEQDFIPPQIQISTPEEEEDNFHFQFYSVDNSHISLSDSIISITDSEARIISSRQMEAAKKTLLKVLTKFDGNFSSYHQFIDTLKSSIDSLPEGTSPLPLISFAIQSCCTPQCYNKLKSLKFNSFDEFKKNVDSTLFASITATSLKNQIETMKQKENQSISDFINEFRLILSNLQSKIPADIYNSDFFQEDIKKILCRNLLPRYKTLALINQKSDLDVIFQEILTNADVSEECNLMKKIDQILVLTSKSNSSPQKQHKNYNAWYQNPPRNPYVNNFHSGNYNPRFSLHQKNPPRFFNNHQNSRNIFNTRQNNYSPARKFTPNNKFIPNRMNNKKHTQNTMCNFAQVETNTNFQTDMPHNINP